MTSDPASARCIETTPPSQSRGRSDAGLMERPVDLAVVTTSGAFVLAGIVWPQAADSLLRLLFATLAAGFITVRAYRRIQSAAASEELYSPFDDESDVQVSAAAPRPLLTLARQLSAADDVRAAERKAIPPAALLTIRTEAERRLTEHHRLALLDPDDHLRIRPLVSDRMWRIIRPDLAGAGPGGRPASLPMVPLSELGRVLDELERL